MIALAATSKNWIIGDGDKIPWRSKEDFAHFRQMTMDKEIIVGRKTWQTLPELKGRKILCLSNSIPWTLYDNPNNRNNTSFSNANYLQSDPNAILCGGASIYKEYLPKCNSLYLTIFDFEVSAQIPIKFPFHREELRILFKNVRFIKKIKDGIIWKYYND